MKKTTKIVILSVLAAVILLGIGYAAIQNITLTIAGAATASANQENFKVVFTGVEEVSDLNYVKASVDETDKTIATIKVEKECLTQNGDTAFAIYNVQNLSKDLAAQLEVTVSEFTVDNNTTEFDAKDFFKVTSEIAEGGNVLQPKNEENTNDETTVKVTIELIKTPIDTVAFKNLKVNLVTKPIQPEAEV